MNKTRCSKCGEAMTERRTAYMVNLSSMKGTVVTLEGVRLCTRCAKKLKDYCYVDENFEKALEEKKNGLSIEECAMKFDLNPYKLRKQYHDFMDRKIKEIEPGTISKVGALFRAGWSLAKIFDELSPDLYSIECRNKVGEDIVRRIIRKKEWLTIHEPDYFDGTIDERSRGEILPDIGEREQSESKFFPGG